MLNRIVISCLVLAAALIAGCSGGPEPEEVVISLGEADGALSSAEVLVDYSQASAAPQIKGGAPECAVLPPNVSATFSDSGTGTMKIKLTAAPPVSAPVDLAVCRMIPESAEVAGATISARLRVALVSATDAGGNALDNRRLAAARTGGRGAGEPTAGFGGTNRGNAGGQASDRSAPQAAPSARSGINAGSSAGTSGSALSDSLRRRSTGNAAKEAQREAERAERANRAQVDDARDAYDRDDHDDGRGGAGAGSGSDLADAKPEEVENDPDVTDATPSYQVTIEVLNNAGALGALQFDVDHTGSSGGWLGGGGTVACNWQVGGGITACNDTAAGRMRCAIASIDGFDTPAPIVTCTFRTSENLTASSFRVNVVDASTPDFKKTTADMAVTQVF